MTYAANAEAVAAALAELYPSESGAIVAALRRRLGPGREALAEEAAQEAWARALASWPARGMPDSPGAWLQRAATNYATDALRRGARYRELAKRLPTPADAAPADAALAGELAEDTAALLFCCADPELPPAGRLALTARVAMGLSVESIASALFCPPATIYQRIHRARQTLAARGALEVPSGDALEPRLTSVLDVLYVAFGAASTPRDEAPPFRLPLLAEVERALRCVCEHPRVAAPRAHALQALVAFQASRLPARVDARTGLVPLERQDRELWDRSRVEVGFAALARAGVGEARSELHVHAAIAACHAASPGQAQTPWARIAALYATLCERNSSFVLTLNRAVAVGRAEHPEAALTLLDSIDDPRAEAHHLSHAVRGDLHSMLGHSSEARGCFLRAAALAPTRLEARYCEARAGAA